MPFSALLRLAVSNGIPRRAAITALIVGPILTAINQGDALVLGNGLDWTKVVLTFMVPYAVATVGAVGAKMSAPEPAAGPCHGAPAALSSGQSRPHPSDPLEAPPLRARIHVTLKNGVLDPQGKAIQHALTALGFEGVDEVRAGKVIEFSLAEEDPDKARAAVEEMCQRLLANTVIENYAIELDGKR